MGRSFHCTVMCCLTRGIDLLIKKEHGDMTARGLVETGQDWAAGLSGGAFKSLLGAFDLESKASKGGAVF